MSGTHFLRSIFITGGFLFFSLLSFAQAPVFTIQNKKDACDGLPNGSFEVLVSSATTGLSIQVFGPPNQGPFTPVVGVPFTINGLQGTAGGKLYLVIVQDDDGSDVQPVTIFTIGLMNASIVSSANNLNCATPNGSIDINVTGGTGSFTYQWSGPAGFVNPGTQDLVGLSGGSYSVNIIDNGTNCTRALGPILITDPSPLSFNVATSTPTVCLGSGGTVTLSDSEIGVNYTVFKGGVSTGITLAGTGNLLSFVIPAGQLTPAATYAFTIRAVNGLCTPVFMNGTANIIVNALPATSPITGDNTICENHTGDIYSVTNTAGSTYAWTVPAGASITAGQGTNSITVTWGSTSGNVSVIETNAAGCLGTPVNLAVAVSANPVTSVITGDNTVCTNHAGDIYSVTNTPTSTYAWTVPAGASITAGQGTNSITVTWGSTSGNVSVIETNAAGCPGTPVNFAVVVSANPTTSAITGDNTVCANHAGDIYSVTNTPTSTYAWTVPAGASITAGQGTNSITVTWGSTSGNVSVTETNAAGCPGTPVNFAVVVSANPTTSAITGDNTICANHAGDIYSVTNTPTSTYAWTVPAGASITAGQGTNSITVTWGSTSGNVSVIETNAAGCPGTPVNFAVVVSANPTTSAITGDNTICANHAGDIYSVINTASSTYAWTVPAGATITAGQGTNTITVTWGSASGNVSVTETSAAGCLGTPVNFAVTVSANPVTSVITGNNTVCENHAGDIYSVTNTATSTYAWTVPAGATITAGQGTSSITVTWGSTSGNVSVTETNAAGCPGTPVNFVVTVNASPSTSVITGTSPVCANTNGISYSVVNTAGSTYAWTIAGGTQASGTNTNSITVDWGAAGAGNVQVTETNTAGCSGASVNFPVTINPAATVDAGSPASVCAGGAVPLSGTRGGGATASIWSAVGGDGNFNNALLLNATYTPGLNDIANGSVTLRLTTNDPAGPCTAVFDDVLITVIASVDLNLPVAAATPSICTGGSTSINVDNSEVGVSYQLRNDANDSNIGPAVIGTGGTISLPTGALAATTTFNILTTGAGCPPGEQNTKPTVTVAGSVNAGLTVTALASPICEGSSTNIQVFSSENGVTYQLRNDAGDVNIGAAVPGTGGTISLPTGNLTVTTVFNVLASNGSCSIELTDIETVVVNIVPDPSLTVGVTIDPLCAGGVTDITVDFSEVGVSYQLRNDAGDINIGSPVVGTGGSINLSTGPLAATTTFNVLATSGVCTPVELTNTVLVTVTGAISAGLTVTAQASPICEGSGTNIQVFSSEAGVSYQLRNDADDSNVGAIVVGTGGTIDLPTGNLTATTVFNVLASNGSCSIELTDIETVTVDVAPDPSLVVGVTIDPLCAGGITDITVDLSEVGVSYQLRNDAGDVNIGSPVAGTGGTINLSTGVLNATTTFNVFASSGVCTSVELTTLATVTVGGAINAGLTLSASSNPICNGTSTNVQVLNSEAGVNYQLRNDSDDSLVGTPVAGNGGTISLPTGNLAASTIFNVLASNVTCAIELTNKQTITVNAGPDISLAVSAVPALVCSGTSTSITITNSEVGVSYQLRNNTGNSPVGPPIVGTGGNISLPTGNLAINTTFNVFATGAGCSAQLTNLATVTLRPVGDPACSGGVNCFAFNVTSVEQRPSCAIQDDGSITFTLTGGSPNYIVTLSDGAGFNISLPGSGPTFAFTNLSPADYTYTIQDAAGNVCTLPYSLPVQTNVIANASGFVNAACFGEAVGQATVTVVSGGASPYFYSLDNGGSWLSFTSPFTITNLAPNGTYSILVADDPSDQCPAEVSVTIGNSNPRIKGVFTVTNATCNASDGSIDVTSTTGGAGGPYTFRIDGVPAPEPFTNLTGGSHIVSMIDNTGCKRDTTITITFPGFVTYSAPATTSDATCTTKGSIGIFIPNPPGSYEVGYTTDPVNEPTNYSAGFYNPATGLVIINNLNGGIYYVWIRTSAAACPTRFENSPGVYEVVIGGPKPLSFEMGCRSSDGVLQLTNISASIADPITYEIFGNGFQKFGSITPDALAQDTIHGFTTGDYIVWLRQDQTTFGCTVYSDTLSAPSGALDTLSVVTNVSFPETPSGSVRVKIQESGAEPYAAWLVETSFRSDTLTAVRNPVTYEVNFTSLAAATYSLYIEDSQGCRKEYSIVLPFDSNIFIPNIFTPNGDDKNETFYVRNLPESGSKLSVTNRWGKEVYSSNNYNSSNLWDGGGSPDGVYYYRLQINGGSTYTGWVEIVRGVKP